MPPGRRTQLGDPAEERCPTGKGGSHWEGVDATGVIPRGGGSLMDWEISNQSHKRNQEIFVVTKRPWFPGSAPRYESLETWSVFPSVTLV